MRGAGLDLLRPDWMAVHMLKGVHRLVLYCADTEASKGWYEAAGFEYSHGYDGMHWFELGASEVMLHPGGSGAGESSPTLHAWASDLDGLFRRAAERGLRPSDHQQPGAALAAPVLRPWGERVFELTDPDGHTWAFTAVE